MVASGVDTGRVVDVHAHAVLTQTLGAAGRYGPELGHDADGRPWYRVGHYVLHGVHYQGSPFMDVGVRLAAMDQAGIDTQLLSPNPLTYYHRVDPATAIRFCRCHNDALAELVADHPGRLLGAAALPMQDLDAALAELSRAVGELGLVAAYVGTDFGRALDDPALDALYEALVDLDVPLFVHPGPTGGVDPPDDPRLRRRDLDLLVGFGYDETLAVADLTLGGVLDRHPTLDVCLSHGGGAAAFLAGRFARACQVRPWASQALRDNGFIYYLRRLWFDCHVHSPGALDLLRSTVGTDRIVFGTNFAGWDSGQAPADPDLAATFSRNSARLLRLDTSRPAGRASGTAGRPA